MKFLRFTKIEFKGITTGFLLVVIVGLFINRFAILVQKTNYSWMLTAASIISPLTGGFIAGVIIKKRAWVYGLVLGITLQLIALSIVFYAFLTPNSMIQGTTLSESQAKGLVQRHLIDQLLYAPIPLALTTFGAFLGEKILNLKSKEKTKSKKKKK